MFGKEGIWDVKMLIQMVNFRFLKKGETIIWIRPHSRKKSLRTPTFYD
jgi:hypothetical protein